MTIIKATSPTSFEVAQTVQTKARAKTCTLDTKNNQMVLITTEPSPAAPPVAGASSAATPPAGGGRSGGGRGNNGPSLLDILVVGR